MPVATNASQLFEQRAPASAAVGRTSELRAAAAPSTSGMPMIAGKRCAHNAVMCGTCAMRFSSAAPQLSRPLSVHRMSVCSAKASSRPVLYARTPTHIATILDNCPAHSAFLFAHGFAIAYVEWKWKFCFLIKHKVCRLLTSIHAADTKATATCLGFGLGACKPQERTSISIPQSGSAKLSGDKAVACNGTADRCAPVIAIGLTDGNVDVWAP